MSLGTINQHLRHAVDEAVLFFQRLGRVLWIKYSNGGDVEKIARVVQERWNNANNAITLEHLFFFEPNQIRQFTFLTKADLRNAIDQTSLDSTKRAFQYLLNVQLLVDTYVGGAVIADTTEIDHRMDMYNEDLQINTYEGDRGAFSDATEIDHRMDMYNEDLQINTYEGDRGVLSDAAEIEYLMHRYSVPAPLPPAPPLLPPPQAKGHANMFRRFENIAEDTEHGEIQALADWLPTVSDTIASNAIKKADPCQWLRLLSKIQPQQEDRYADIMAQLFLNLRRNASRRFQNQLDDCVQDRGKDFHRQATKINQSIRQVTYAARA